MSGIEPPVAHNSLDRTGAPPDVAASIPDGVRGLPSAAEIWSTKTTERATAPKVRAEAESIAATKLDNNRQNSVEKRRTRMGSAREKGRSALGVAWPPRQLSLALQGGGSFGAFTWGVLDRLLEEPNCDFDAISGASVGAVNAVLLASGFIEGGRKGART